MQPPILRIHERLKSKASLNSSAVAPGLRLTKKNHTLPVGYSTTNGVDDGHKIPGAAGFAYAVTINSFQRRAGNHSSLRESAVEVGREQGKAQAGGIAAVPALI
jgi:hypothetical protein